jgi:arginine-tRNA-protein transferase
MTCEDYQDLIDRGWRRSGKYCYKPVMDVTCSPQYAIRCEATRFRLSKSQKKVLKTMADYLVKGERKEEKSVAATVHSASEVKRLASTSVDPINDAKTTTSESKPVEGGSKKGKSVRPGVGADPTKPPCRKAKEIRKERKLKKMAAAVATVAESGDDSAKASVAVRTEDSSDSTRDVQQTSSVKRPEHGDESIPDFLRVGPDGKKPLEAFLTLPTTTTDDNVKLAHRLEMKLIRSHPPSPEFKSTFRESFKLFQKYQMKIHNDSEDDCDEKMYRRFLCDSPLMPKRGVGGWPCDYGSYHHQYRLDGRLIAVGVVDFLPKCLSSVYTFYDPDFNFLSLGVYTALREFALTRQMYLKEPRNFRYYCMGYYVHACQKMRYKGEYYPSVLLCPESYQFIPIETCRPKLDASRYARLNDEATPPEDVSTWVDKSLVLFQRTIMPFAVYRTIAGSGEDAKVTEYARFVGPSVAPRMVLVLS